MVVGAQKCGTSALAHFLQQHPLLDIAKGKEVHLFDKPSGTSDYTVAELNDCYKTFFPAVKADHLWGEATPIYMFWPGVMQELKRYNPDLKLLVVLRNPADRAISQYYMQRGRGEESRSLSVALLGELLARIGSRFGRRHYTCRVSSYLSRGFYADQLSEVLKYFDSKQVLVLDHEYLQSEHNQAIESVLSFLGVGCIKIAPSSVFKGEYSDKKVLKYLLNWYFKKSNTHLNQILPALRVAGEFTWLK